MTSAAPGTDTTSKVLFSKVPEVTLIFWIIKIFCTTLGETGGDAVTMSMNLGYLVGTLIFAAIFLVAVAAQIYARRFHPFLYWTTIIATTTVGTTMADFSDRSLGIGYAGGSLILLGLLLTSLGVWYWSMGSISVNTVNTPKVEMFYWVTIMFSQTLGTALGDWSADSAGLGYSGAAVIFGLLLALVAACHFWTKISKTALFWAAAQEPQWPVWSSSNVRTECACFAKKGKLVVINNAGEPQDTVITLADGQTTKAVSLFPSSLVPGEA